MNSLVSILGGNKQAAPLNPYSGAFAAVIAAYPPWARYYGSATDTTGNGRNGTVTGTVTSGSGIGNGATASIPYITGTITDSVTFPSGSIPTNFTICAITRYTGSYNQRILTNTSTGNYIFGHHTSGMQAYFNGTWATDANTFASLGISSTDWLVFCGKNGGTVPNNVLFNNIAKGTASGGTGSGILSINGFSTGELSDWGFSHLIIWDKVLSDTDMATVSNALKSYLTTGEF